MPSNLLNGRRRQEKERGREQHKIRNERRLEREGKSEDKWVSSALKNAVVG